MSAECGAEHLGQTWDMYKRQTGRKRAGRKAEPGGGQRSRYRDPRLHKRAWTEGEMDRQRTGLKP